MLKKLIFILLSLFCFFTLTAQCNYTSDTTLYQKAYDYIISDGLFSEKTINVSEKLVGTSYLFFLDELKENNDLEPFYKKLYDLDEQYGSDNSDYSYFSELFATHTNPNSTLCFSKIINSELFAEVRIGNSWIKGFGETVYYYFEFDLNGNLKTIYKKKLHGL